jgi:hypothetical protein
MPEPPPVTGVVLRLRACPRAARIGHLQQVGA